LPENPIYRALNLRTSYLAPQQEIYTTADLNNKFQPIAAWYDLETNGSCNIQPILTSGEGSGAIPSPVWTFDAYNGMMSIFIRFIP